MVLHLWSATVHSPTRSYTDLVTGVDSEQLRWGKDEQAATDTAPPSSEPTIEEDKLAEAEDDYTEFSRSGYRTSKRNSYQRLSRLSDEARLSVTTKSGTPDYKGTDSNRSSTTIKGIQINGKGVLNDVDFEKALRKFATERDSFLSDLTLSAGAVVPNRPKPRPKTQRITKEDGAGLKSGVGSIRRRISFRDVKRTPSNARPREFGKPHHISHCISDSLAPFRLLDLALCRKQRLINKLQLRSVHLKD